MRVAHLFAGSLVAAAVMAAPAAANPHSQAERGHGVECERREGGARCLHRAGRQPAPRVAHVRDDPRGDPRRPERHRSPLSAVCVPRPRAARRVPGRRRRRGRARRARAASSASSGAVPAGMHRRRRRQRGVRLRGRARRDPGRASQGPRAAPWATPPRRPILALRAGDGAGHHTGGLRLPAGHRARRVATSRPDRPFAFAPGWADVTPFVLEDAIAVPARSAVRADAAGSTPPISTRSRRSAATASPRRARAPPSRPRSRCSGSRAHRCSGTGSRGPSRPTARLDPWESARLFGLLNMALADGYIGSFDTKYHYNFWRPVTAIRAADTDGNPAHERRPDVDAAGDRRRRSPTTTRPTRRRRRGRRRCSGGSSGPTASRFSTCSLTLPAGQHVRRRRRPCRAHYASFSQAAEENGVSRILVGFHFRKAVDEGIEHGRQDRAPGRDRFLRPVR